MTPLKNNNSSSHTKIKQKHSIRNIHCTRSKIHNLLDKNIKKILNKLNHLNSNQ